MKNMQIRNELSVEDGLLRVRITREERFNAGWNLPPGAGTVWSGGLRDRLRQILFAGGFSFRAKYCKLRKMNCRSYVEGNQYGSGTGNIAGHHRGGGISEL